MVVRLPRLARFDRADGEALEPEEDAWGYPSDLECRKDARWRKDSMQSTTTLALAFGSRGGL